MNLEDCKAETVGKVGDAEVAAITDMAGPQVVVKGGKTHLISNPLKSHAAAVRLAKRVVAHGTACYEHWTNLKTASVFDQLFVVFGAGLRQQG